MLLWLVLVPLPPAGEPRRGEARGALEGPVGRERWRVFLVDVDVDVEAAAGDGEGEEWEEETAAAAARQFSATFCSTSLAT